MDNMRIYEQSRAVPKEAQRPIAAGRLKGKTDINPMWRIKKLTELFGPVGIGWYAQPVEKKIYAGADGVQVATVDLNLFIKVDGEWSAPIFGTGGSTLVDKESKGLYTSDEAFKMAYTDALSVCCKMLGIGADIYWSADATKYNGQAAPHNQPKLICACCGKEIRGVQYKGEDFTPFAIANRSQKKYGKTLCWTCSKQEANRAYDAAYDDRAPEQEELPPWEAQG